MLTQRGRWSCGGRPPRWGMPMHRPPLGKPCAWAAGRALDSSKASAQYILLVMFNKVNLIQ
jgi:hypothetical protein